MESREFFLCFGKLLYCIDGFYNEYAKHSKIKQNLLWFLYAISDGKIHSQKEICKSWELPKSTINTIAKELESKSYIKLIHKNGEKRELCIVLTDLGKKLMEELLSDLFKKEKIVFDEIKNESESILNGLKIINEKLNSMEDKK